MYLVLLTARTSTSFTLARRQSVFSRRHLHHRTTTTTHTPHSSFSSAAASSSCLASTVSSSSSSAETLTKLRSTLGQPHPSYEVVSTDHVEEYNAFATLYRHKKSGAEVLSVSADDDNKVFGITFRTPPADSTGVAHILEHSVLCGSRKYPTKEPFVELIKGSLNTFLNAFTYPDRTCYPVASQNTKDFYNLVNVYLDAVLHPRATSDPFVHAQEGWHYELEDKDSPLVYKGVVYNEMKGVYSSPDSLLSRESQRSLFPDNAYGVDSGGDPRVIPDLSFEDFRDFHRSKYDPSNSRVFFYGDDDVTKRLDLLNEYLQDFTDTSQSETSAVSWQKKKFSSPVVESHAYPVTPDQPQTSMINVNWLLNDEPMSDYDELALNVLDHLLLGTPSSTLRKTLMESGLGDALTGGGLSDELLQATFSIGLKGVGTEKVDEVTSLIDSTFSDIRSKGFEDSAIAASMNSLEFQLREFNTGSFPKGLSVMLGCMSKWNYDRDPTSALKFEETLGKLKSDIDSRGSAVFTDLIDKYFLQNTHRSTIVMNPDVSLEERVVNEEKERLAEVKSTLSDNDLEEIIEKTRTLKELQAAEDPPEAIATIPSLTLADLETKVKEYPIEIVDDHAGTGITLVKNEMSSTSGVLYSNFLVDTSSVDLDEALLIPILTRVMIEGGAGDMDDVTLSRAIGTYTGGIDVSMSMTPVMEGSDVKPGVVSDGMKMISKLNIRGKCTAANAPKMYELMNTILTSSNLDCQSKVVEILKEKQSRLQSSIQGSGHSFANSRLRARYSVNGFLDEQFSGITSLATVKSLLKQAENDWPTFLSRLESLRTTILDPSRTRSGMILNTVGDSAVLAEAAPAVDSFLSNLPGDAKGEKIQNFYETDHPWCVEARKRMASTPPSEGFVVPTQVNYVGSGGRLFDVGEEMDGSSTVVARHLRTGYLWDTVRVIGGAYGGFCTLGGKSGIFTFLSYRDPNLAVTLDAYSAAADALLEQAEKLTPEQLQTAIIGTVGDMDGALSPDQKGSTQFTRWLTNESPEQRQLFRDQVLGTTKEDFIEFAKKLKGLKASLAVVSSKGSIEEAIASGKNMEMVEIL